MLIRFFQYSLSPKILLPMRTRLEPSSTAIRQSWLIPMEMISKPRNSGTVSVILRWSEEIAAKSSLTLSPSSVLDAIPIIPHICVWVSVSNFLSLK